MSARRIVAFCSALLVCSHAAFGLEVISVNFDDNGGPGPLAAGEEAGFVRAVNWNNCGTNATNLLNNSGVGTGVDLSASAPYDYVNATSTALAGNGGDYKLMSTHRGNTGSSTSYSFTNIPYGRHSRPGHAGCDSWGLHALHRRR
jgi:hypothetical protein